MKKYDHKKIETKWQKVWEKKKLGKAAFPSSKKKFYGLIEFPYPSGEGLHVGHIRSNTAMDIIARKRHAEGYNVLYPIGWDAFGLPTENYAIKTGKAPQVVTKKNTDNFRRQLKAIGFAFDWSREINTTDPNYYKWTQWIFLQFFKKGLAYKAKSTINWCPSCKVGLANEEAIGGVCERCGGVTEKREKEQWMLAITKYADRLDKDLDKVDYLPQVVTQQRNWIGRSEGSEIEFPIKNSKQKIKVFTTRPDTIFGATYMVVAPEHKLIEENKNAIENLKEVEAYIFMSLKKDEIQRTDANKEKTGIEIKGLKAINPANNEEIPIFVADYVLGHYGTGAIMAVPAHDERDYAFAKKFGLPIKEVVVPNRIDANNPPVEGKKSVERKNVQVIVHNKSNNKYLALKWKKHPWVTFPMGGVEEGEDIVTAAKREVLEETGYKNLKFIKVLGGQVRAEYFAAHKDQNRVAFTNAVMFELTNEEKAPVSKEEEESYDIIWLAKNEITYPKVVHAELNDWLERWDKEDSVYTEDGIMINSGKFNNLANDKAKKEITKFVKGKSKITYKLRDWVFSRQRYWGEPIPLINCAKCGWVAVPEKQLPVKLPPVKNYKPTDNGESPLSAIKSFVNVKCPKCKSGAKRETDTMPQWAGSSWYYLAYMMQGISNFKFPISKYKKTFKYWSPVDWYNGGMEHTTLHLLYSRFWHKFLYDLKLVPTIEPYAKRTSHGLILAQGGVKMSKSKGNVINPDDIVKVVGADTLRLYEMFMGPFDQAISWSTDSMAGCRRFIERVYALSTKVSKDKKLKASEELEVLFNQTIKKVSEDYEAMHFNTAISSMMIFANELEKQDSVKAEHYDVLLKLLSPITPHFTEEVSSAILGNRKSIHDEAWPKFDKRKIVSKKIKIGVSVNGKLRGTIELGQNTTEEEAVALAKRDENISKWLKDGIKKTIFIQGKILNFVV